MHLQGQCLTAIIIVISACPLLQMKSILNIFLRYTNVRKAIPRTAILIPERAIMKYFTLDCRVLDPMHILSRLRKSHL